MVNATRDVVNNLDGLTSLREAIAYANSLAGSNTITFASGLAGTTTLDSALPQITGNVTIQGPGAVALTVPHVTATEPVPRTVLAGTFQVQVTWPLLGVTTRPFSADLPVYVSFSSICTPIG